LRGRRERRGEARGARGASRGGGATPQDARVDRRRALLRDRDDAAGPTPAARGVRTCPLPPTSSVARKTNPPKVAGLFRGSPHRRPRPLRVESKRTRLSAWSSGSRGHQVDLRRRGNLLPPPVVGLVRALCTATLVRCEAP